MVLTPGWRDLAGSSIAQIAIAQWTAATRAMLDDLVRLAPERWAVTDFAALAGDPVGELKRLGALLGLTAPAPPQVGAPESFVIAASPEIEASLGALPAATVGVAEAAHDLLAAPVSRRPTSTPDRESQARSAYSPELATVLAELTSSLLLSTGELNRLVCITSDGARLTTHFVASAGPRALAGDGGELAVAGPDAVDRYRDTAADGCFEPYERAPVAATALAFAGGTLWAAHDDAIEPLGGAAPAEPIALERPVSGIAPGPEGPAYATQDDGAIIDCATRTEVGRLAVPRAPRLRDGTLWVLERDAGRLVAIELDTGNRRAEIDLPGVAEGLAIVGSIAFVGLSRGTAGEFSGVIAVDLGRETAGPFLRFEGAIPGVCDLAVLPRRGAAVRVPFPGL